MLWYADIHLSVQGDITRTEWLRAFFTAAALAAIGNAAKAEDATIDWSGAYVGLSVATNQSDIDTTDVNGVFSYPFALQDISASGTNVGGLLGYNFQRGSLVYGVELAFANGGASGSSIVDTVNLDETLQWEVKSSTALTARVGKVVGKTMYFGSLGLARASASFGYLNLDDAGTVVEQDNRIESTFDGYVVGLGVEHGLSAKITLRGELLHSNFSSQTLEGTPGFAPIEYAPSNTSIRVGVAYRF